MMRFSQGGDSVSAQDGESMRSRLLPVGIAVLLAAAAVGLWRSSHRAPGEVRIAYLPIIPSLPVFVVQEQHLFEKENLKVAMLSLNSSNDLVNALVAGQADLLPGVSIIPIIHLEIQHPGLVRVFSHSRMSENNALDKIIVKENSSLHSVQDLQGRKMGVFPGTAPEDAGHVPEEARREYGNDFVRATGAASPAFQPGIGRGGRAVLLRAGYHDRPGARRVSRAVRLGLRRPAEPVSDRGVSDLARV